jgi:PhoH-like ATPase
MISSSSTKIFILDTNVILHDSACINNFQEHDIVIPITVLEELDQFKKGNRPSTIMPVSLFAPWMP